MRLRKKLLSACIIISFLVFFLSPPIASYLLRNALKKAFSADSVDFFKIKLNADHISISDIKMARNNLFDVHVKHARLYWGWPVSRDDPGLELTEAEVNLSLRNKNISDIKGLFFKEGSGMGFLRRLSLSDIRINIVSRDLNADMLLSSDYDLGKRKVEYLRMEIGSARSGQFDLEGFSCAIEENQPVGSLKVKKIGLGKLSFERITGDVSVNDNALTISNLKAEILQGSIFGRADLVLRDGIAYAAMLDVQGINSKDLLSDLGLNEKLDMTGLFSGQLHLEGHNGYAKNINGEFSVAPAGGILVLKDESWLKSLLDRQEKVSSSITTDFIIAGFKDYNYDKAVVKLYLSQEGLSMDALFDGPQGNRDIRTSFHDFSFAQLLYTN